MSTRAPSSPVGAGTARRRPRGAPGCRAGRRRSRRRSASWSTRPRPATPPGRSRAGRRDPTTTTSGPRPPPPPPPPAATSPALGPRGVAARRRPSPANGRRSTAPAPRRPSSAGRTAASTARVHRPAPDVGQSLCVPPSNRFPPRGQHDRGGVTGGWGRRCRAGAGRRSRPVRTGDDLGADRDGRLLGRARPEVEPDRRADAGDARVVDALLAQPLDPRRRACAGCPWRRGSRRRCASAATIAGTSNLGSWVSTHTASRGPRSAPTCSSEPVRPVDDHLVGHREAPPGGEHLPGVAHRDAVAEHLRAPRPARR